MQNQGTYNTGRIAVPAPFEEVFSHFYFAENNTAQAMPHTLLPSYQTMMAFSFGAPIVLTTREKDDLVMDTCLVAGPIKQAFDYTLSPGSSLLVANFKDDAFSRFFGSAAFAKNFSTHPDTMLQDDCFTVLWKELCHIPDTQDRVNHLLAFCQPYLRNRHPIVEQIAGFTNPNLSAVKEISEKNQLSERAVQMHHKKHFGYSAKEIARYQRFLKAIEMIRAITGSDRKVDWFDIIEGCGYYDQSQLIHDFKHYLHVSPTQYLKFQQSICRQRD